MFYYGSSTHLNGHFSSLSLRLPNNTYKKMLRNPLPAIKCIFNNAHTLNLNKSRYIVIHAYLKVYGKLPSKECFP